MLFLRVFRKLAAFFICHLLSKSSGPSIGLTHLFNLAYRE